MKKFILMLALSLGGIVSAQSFSFNCGGFSTEEVADLYEAEFEANGGVFQHGSSQHIVIELDSDGLYHVINEDTQDDDTFSDLAAAIVAADAAAVLPDNSGDDNGDNGVVTDPDTDGDGFTDAEEVTLATYSHLNGEGFVDGDDRSYRLNGTGDYHLLITITEDGIVMMTEVGGSNAVWPNDLDPTPLTVSAATTIAINYFDGQ